MLNLNQSSFYETSDGEQIFYVRNFKNFDPSRPVLVFNYGLVCSNMHWQYQTNYFDQLGYQILIHDYRGHFQSSGKERIEKITFKQMAKDIAGICQSLELKNIVMLGHSMGVNVCLQFAVDFPELVSGLVLVSGTFMPVRDVMFDSNVMEFITPIVSSALDKYPNFINTIWSTAGLNPIIKEIIHTTGFNRKKVSSEFIEIYLNKIGELGPRLFFQLFQEMTLQNIISHLHKIKVPTLVIGGLKDNVIPNHLQRTLAEIIPSSETYFLKDGSHVPQADFPELINERINLFVHQRANQF